MARQGQNDQERVGIEYLSNREAEDAVLGSILIDPEALLLIRPMLSDVDFFSPYCASVYRAMLRLTDAGRAVDVLTLTDEIQGRGGDPTLLAAMIAHTPTSVHAMHYAHIVAELGARRRLISSAGRIIEMAADEDRDLDAVIGDAFGLLRTVTERAEADVVPTEVAASEFADDLARWVNAPDALYGLPTGLRRLDEMTGGFENELVIIGGRPSHGKSALLLQIANHIANLGHGVAYFSLEMPVGALQRRLLSLRTQTSSSDIRRGKITPEQHSRLLGELAAISRLPIWWCDRNIQRVDRIVAHVAQLRARHDIRAVFVDYIQLMDAEAENRNLALGKISRGLANLAHEQRLSVFAGAQVNRGVESREEQMPRLSDLRESGNIEQDADAVIFGNRPEVRLIQEGKRWADIPSDIRGKVQLSLAKRRNGEIGPLEPILFYAEYGLFAEEAPPEGEQWWHTK